MFIQNNRNVFLIIAQDRSSLRLITSLAVSGMVLILFSGPSIRAKSDWLSPYHFCNIVSIDLAGRSGLYFTGFSNMNISCNVYYVTVLSPLVSRHEISDWASAQFLHLWCHNYVAFSSADSYISIRLWRITSNICMSRWCLMGQ